MSPFLPTLQLLSTLSASGRPWHGACESPHRALVTHRMKPNKRSRHDARPLANGPSREDVMAAPTAELSTLPPRLETLLEITRQLSAFLPLEKLLGKMAEACGSLLDSDSVGIRVVEGDELVLMGVWGDAQTAMPNARIKIGESLTGTVVATGKPLLLSDPANDPRIAPASRAAYLRGGYRAFLGVPLKIGEQVLGALSIRTLRAEGFSSEDVSIATAFAAQAAIALENARLYREAEARADKLKALSALTRLMTSAEGASEVCQAVARAATTLLGAASTRVSVADPVARGLRTEGGFSFDPQVEQIVTEVPVIPYGEGLTGRIAESRTPDYILDIGNDPKLRNRRLSTVAGLRGFAGLPLIADEQTVGVLAIFFREPRSFTSEERELIALLADQAAIAIRNARMREAVQTHQNHLETLLEADLANDLRVTATHRESCSRRGYRAMLAVPVKVGERVVGVLTILSRRPEGFCAEDLIIATAFAAQAAVALENSRLYHETQRAYEELAQTQDQLAQAGKMEAIGHLAGGVAHDFNNLLMVIMGRTEMLMKDLGDADPRHSTAKVIEQTAPRAADLTRQLLAFSRKQVLNPAVLDLNAVVSKMGEMLRRLIGEDIALVTGLGSSLGHVKADPGQIEQIIMNLAVNARDAMPEGGRLTLETANIELDVAYARKHVGARPGPHVMLALSDTGTGMDAQTQARIFEPFFTTKGPRKGTGLGLAMVYGIVKQSGGNIWVYSEPGQGTTFKIYLPRVGEPVDAGHGGVLLAAPAHGMETILLVEDEDAVRDLARDILAGCGYTVLEARHGAEALGISAAHAGKIDLMLTDVVMPEMNGRELAERLAAQRPETKVLYMSGYTDHAVVHHGVLAPQTEFLQKPFTEAVLTRKLRELLDA